jgi:hypothetical protein
MKQIPQTTQIIRGLLALRFFPDDPNARQEIIDAVSRMVANDEQARWLVQMMLCTFDDWPGLNAVRELFSIRYKPQDEESFQ